jgi:hypothetical protein
MTTIAELDRQIAALQAQKAELEKQWPKQWSRFWYLDSGGNVETNYFEADVEWKYELITVGNVFRTPEAAEHRRKQMIVTQKLRDISGDWKPDWKSGKWDKRFLYYCHEDKEWKIHSGYNAQVQGIIYFPTYKAAQAAIALGDELNCLLEDV